MTETSRREMVTDPVPNVTNNEIRTQLPARLQEALEQANGEVRVAAEILKMPVRKLDYIIRFSADVKRFLKLMKDQRIASEWDNVLTEQLEEDIKRSALIYKREALEAIADLAMMKISENSGQNQVKLMAAARLYADTGSTVVGDEIDSTLRALNAEYQKTAPRIKSVRERVITFEESPQPEPRVIGQGDGT